MILVLGFTKMTSNYNVLVHRPHYRYILVFSDNDNKKRIKSKTFPSIIMLI